MPDDQQFSPERELQSVRERLKFVEEAAGLGTWDWDPGSDTMHSDSAYFQSLGYDDSLKDWRQLIHPDDAHRFDQTMAALVERKSPAPRVEVRIRQKDGQYVQ